MAEEVNLSLMAAPGGAGISRLAPAIPGQRVPESLAAVTPARRVPAC